MRPNKHLVVALFFWSTILGNLLLVPCADGQITETDHLSSNQTYLQQLQVSRQENWLSRNLREFRTFPHMDQAYRLMKAGKLQEARKELENYLAIDPGDLKARYTYLMLLAKIKDYPEVISQANLILQQKSTFVPALIYRGLAQQKIGQLRPALKDFQAVADNVEAQKEDKKFALNTAADLALREKDYSLALATLDKIDSDGRGYDYFLTQGYALEGLKRLPEAITSFNQAATITQNPEARRKAYLALGEAAKKAHDFASARQAYQLALEQDPKNSGLMRELGQLAYVQKDFAAAAGWLSQAQKIAPEPTNQEFLINVWEAGKDYQAATKEIIKRLQETSNAQERYNLYIKLGYTYNKRGRPAQAAEAFREALRIKKDVPTMTLLANTLEKSGRLAESFKIYQEIACRDPRGEIYFTLGDLASRLENNSQALKHFSMAVQKHLPASQQLAAYKQIGYISTLQQNYAQARRALQLAAELSPREINLYASLVDLCNKMGDLPSALAYQQKLVTLTRDYNCNNSQNIENLGYLYAKLGRYQESVDAFEQAIAAGQESAELRLNLGYLYLKLHNIPSGLENFQASLKLAPKAETYLALGRCYKELNQPGVAVYYLSKARSFLDALPRPDQIDLLSTLGYLYAEEDQYSRATLCFSKSLQLHYDPVIALRLARMERLSGQSSQALLELQKIDPARLPADSKPLYLEEKAASLQNEGDLPAAVEQLEKAAAISDTASLHYRLGLLHGDLKQVDAAIQQFQEARELDLRDNNYAVALGYALLKKKNYSQAAALFEEVLSRDSDYLKLYEDLGYIYMKDCRNTKAVTWFKRAIDNRLLYSINSTAGAEELDQKIYDFRKEITKMNHRWDFTVYLGYRSSKTQQVNVPGGLLGGSILANNGVELAYQPPVIGFRDERIFQGYVRVLWGNEPGSLSVNSDTFQGGAGLRYKPFKSQNFWLSGERLFKIGDQAMNDWLVRALYSWDNGYDLQYNRPRWNYSFIYGEGDYFFQGIWAYYWELRQGITFNYRNKFLITPHFVADMRYQDPCNPASSYLEGGGGLSLKFLYNETHYEINRSSFELLVYYKFGRFINQGVSINGNGYNGVTVLAVNRF
jgi:tetratricopeptide (TPR) repeat protein